MHGHPCHGDVFHALQPFLDLTIYLENRAFGAISTIQSIERKLVRPRPLSEHDKNKALQRKWAAAQRESQKAIQFADDICILYSWPKQDILSLVGPRFEERQALFDFVTESLHSREESCPHKIHPIRTFLENHRDNLLAFAKQIDKRIEALAEEFEVNPHLIRSVYEAQGMPLSSQSRWEKEATLRKKLGAKFHSTELKIKKILEETVRASSVVENLNSRLRNYFTLRKVLDKEYLTLLQFFLNHRRFMRSERPERVDKSPRELLTKEEHPHWLELLGFTLFQQAA